MALDQQRNWTVSMADSLEQVKRHGGKESRSKAGQDDSQYSRNTFSHPAPKHEWTSAPIHLPDEIILQILEHASRTSSSQYTLASCCRLSRQWYEATIPFLYSHPHIKGKNFESFTRAICPSKNLHIRKSVLADLVKTLDMSQLVHSGSKSTTARLLSRTKGNLETFIAPQASFAMNCFPALGKCRELKMLDLSLVSESPPLLDLFRTVSHLEKLISLRLPRSAGFSTGFSSVAMSWPPNLEHLCLSGGIDAHFIHGIAALPTTLKSLAVEHCPMAKTGPIMHMLQTAVRPLPNLEILTMRHLPRLNPWSLDDILINLPGLTKLSVSVDYITCAMFDINESNRKDSLSATLQPCYAATRHAWSPGRACQLRTLELTNSGNPGVEDKITPIDLLIAVQDGSLPNLRKIRVANSLFWHTGGIAAETEALADALKESAILQGSDGADTGVWTFDG